jgi:hypothetical protein
MKSSRKITPYQLIKSYRMSGGRPEKNYVWLRRNGRAPLLQFMIDDLFGEEPRVMTTNKKAKK